MNEIQQAVHDKMQRIIREIGKGPLSCLEEAELIESLQRIDDDTTLWGVAIKKHFADGNTDHSYLLGSLASQCKDDIFTMACIVGLRNAVQLLRTLN